VSRLLQEAIGLYLETAKDLPEAERAAFLSRPVPFWTRPGFAIEAFWSTLRARADGDLKHQFTIQAKSCSTSGREYARRVHRSTTVALSCTATARSTANINV
jgi:hypothetical protein